MCSTVKRSLYVRVCDLSLNREVPAGSLRDHPDLMPAGHRARPCVLLSGTRGLALNPCYSPTCCCLDSHSLRVSLRQLPMRVGSSPTEGAISMVRSSAMTLVRSPDDVEGGAITRCLPASYFASTIQLRFEPSSQAQTTHLTLPSLPR